MRGPSAPPKSCAQTRLRDSSATSEEARVEPRRRSARRPSHRVASTPTEVDYRAMREAPQRQLAGRVPWTAAAVTRGRPRLATEPVGPALWRHLRSETARTRPPGETARSHRINEAPSLGFGCLPTKAPHAIVALVFLTSTIRSQGSSPSQRFDPARGSWVCFAPHPSIGFLDLQSFSRSTSRSTSRCPLLSCRWPRLDRRPDTSRSRATACPKTHVTRTKPASASELCSSRASDTRHRVVHPAPSRCSLGLCPPSRFASTTVGPEALPSCASFRRETGPGTTGYRSGRAWGGFAEARPPDPLGVLHLVHPSNEKERPSRRRPSEIRRERHICWDRRGTFGAEPRVTLNPTDLFLRGRIQAINAFLRGG